MKIINSELITCNVRKIIKHYSNGTLKIHSIFNKVINIQIENRLVCIAYNEEHIPPFGVVINKNDFDYLANRINKDTVLILNGNKLKFADNIMVDLLIWKEPQIQYFNIDGIEKSNVKQNTDFLRSIVELNNWECGFEHSFSDIMDSIIGRTKYLEEFEEKVCCVLNIDYIDEKKLHEFFNYFLGRGKGLTPSGDDLIIGLLAVYNNSYIKINIINKALEDFIVEKPHITTRISYEYIYYALRNEFSSCINKLIFSLFHENKSKVLENVNIVRKFGNTSSVDTIIGIIIGIYSLRRGDL